MTPVLGGTPTRLVFSCGNDTMAPVHQAKLRGMPPACGSWSVRCSVYSVCAEGLAMSVSGIECYNDQDVHTVAGG